MENVTNVAKPTNVKKIALGGSLGLALVLGVVGFMAPQPKATIAKTPETQNVDAKQTKESLDDAFKLDFNHGLSKTVAKEASSPLISTPTHAHQNHTIPPAPSAAPAPVAKTATCGQMDPTIAGEIRDWQSQFTKDKIEQKIGNSLPTAVKQKLTNVKNKRQLVDGIIYYIETNSTFKTKYAKELSKLKAAGNDEAAIKIILLGLSSKLSMDGVPYSVVQFLLLSFQGTNKPYGWDVIAEHAKAKGILLTLTYSKDQCNKHVAKPQPVKKQPVVHSKPYVPAVHNVSSSANDKPYCSNEFLARIGRWTKQFELSNLKAQGIDKELPANIITLITKVKNKQQLIDAIIKYMETDSSLTATKDEVIKAVQAHDEMKIAGALTPLAAQLMGSKPATVKFLLGALMGTKGWDTIREDAKKANVIIKMDTLADSKVCYQNQLPWPETMQKRIADWRKNFELSNLTQLGIDKELPASIINDLKHVLSKRMLIDVIIKYMETDPKLATIKDTVIAAVNNGDEMKIAGALTPLAGQLMGSKPATVQFLLGTLMGPKGWDLIRDDAKALKPSVTLPMNYLVM